MDLDITRAVERAAAKKNVLGALSGLPKAAWRDLMVEILVEHGVFTNGAVTPGNGQPDAAKPVAVPQHAGSKTAELVAILTQAPRTPVSELAQKIYGASDPPAVKRATALLVSLKRQGRAKTVGRGRWEVTHPKS